MRLALIALGLAALSSLSACDMLGIESASTVAGRREAEGKAIGGACRHAGRAIEDCYTLNKKADKGAVFAGWREMNDYMRENKIEAVAPTQQPPGAATQKSEHDPVEPEEKPAKTAAADKKHAKASAH